MRIRFALPALVAFLPLVSLLAAETSDANADALKTRIIAHARTVTADDYAYTRTVRTESTEGDKKEGHVIVERWDPAKPFEQRWTMISIDGKSPDADQQKEYRNALPKRRQAYYGRVAGYFAKPATSTIDARGRTIFHFASLRRKR
ncbi:MAG: hypothetical protein ABJB09_03220 [Verrucomicrobiota bacterium]